MTYLGDFVAGSVLDHKFTTVQSTGAPTTLAGTPALSVYKDNSTTQSTTGVTLSVDFDSVTGLNNVRVDTSADGTFYAAGSNFQIVITTGTVNSVSAVGYVVGSFSIEARNDKADVREWIGSAVATPTTAGVPEVDVTFWNGSAAPAMTGDAFARLGAPVGASISADIAAVKTQTAAIETDTQDIQSRLPAALTAGGNIKADALAISGDTVAADNLEAAADGTGYNLGGGSVVAASVTGNVGGSTGSVAAGGITASSFGAGAIDAAALAADAGNEIADALLARNVAGGSSAGRTVKQAFAVLRNKVVVSGGTLTVYDTDDTTVLYTAAVTTAAGDPIDSVDPS